MNIYRELYETQRAADEETKELKELNLDRVFAKYDVQQYLSKNTEFATQIFIYDFQENDASEEKAEGLAILENIFPNLESKIVQYLA